MHLLGIVLLFLSTVHTYDFDVLVYGSTPAGVLASDAAAGEGVSVALLDPRGVVGGAIAGGLCETDTGTTLSVIGGRTRKFFHQVSLHYNSSSGSMLFAFEPKVAVSVFTNYFLASKPSLTLLLNTRIAGLAMDGPRITGAVLANGTVLTAKVFVDATYEGALLPMAKVDFSYGREPNTTFGEGDAGVLPPSNPQWNPLHPYVAQHQLYPPVRNPYFPNGTAVPYLTPSTNSLPLGSGDSTTQAYAFRTTLTTNKSNMVQPWPRPLNYNPSDFELVRLAIVQKNLTTFQSIVGLGGKLPSEKYDNNNHDYGQFVGLSWPYPAAVAANDFAAQQAVWDAHRYAYLGLFYFLATDPNLPPGFAQGATEIGLPLDEHVDTGHFPGALYVREALRLQGAYVFTQHDVEGGVNHSDSIAMGSYSIDIMHHGRYVNASGWVVEEGGIQGPSFLNKTLPPFQVPFRALLPKQAQATNLIVPVALSSSHVGFNAVRLEPTWMAVGESAGVAAAILALNASVTATAQTLDVGVLVKRLIELGQVLHL